MNNTLHSYVVGQRWISEMEPELGLGTITRVEHRRVHMEFTGSLSERCYSREAAPVKRVRFDTGDTVTSRDQVSFRVECIKEIEGLIVYCGEGVEIVESDLSDTISFSTPEHRLFQGLVDSNQLFNLRLDTLTFRSSVRNSSVRGYSGARIDLIPHQLYIAGEICSRYYPRVLLSDEVGLGKTIEACLILHRLLICERISRVLIIVPDPLVNQWFVELLRKFNLLFRIIDEPHCRSLERGDSEINPFTDDQLCICGTGFIKSDSRKEQILCAGWDMLVVDEVHHIAEKTPEFFLVEALSRKSRGVMLLTATPEQYGTHNHVAHLRLLDPSRYTDVVTSGEASLKYRNVADLLNALGKKTEPDDGSFQSLLTTVVSESREMTDHFLTLYRGSHDDRETLTNEILDVFGTGRNVYRNTRAVVTGFPNRVETVVPLKGTVDDIDRANLEISCDSGSGIPQETPDYSSDPRVRYLAELIHKTGNEKILVICRTKELSYAIDSALKTMINVSTALFNESMTLIQRDRSAAWFSEKDGARIMICSEIGSEGRNFQFSRFLVMFDLPLNPDLVEQRIGRLDRIGQLHDVEIHVPYIEGSAHEILVAWHSRGNIVFRKHFSGQYYLFREFENHVRQLIHDRISGKKVSEQDLNRLVTDTNSFLEDLAVVFESGRDRLLELNSFRSEPANRIISELEHADTRMDADRIMDRLFNHYGFITEELMGTPRSFRIKNNSFSDPEFPVPPLKKNGMTVTFDRKIAITREDMEFLSQDSPLVTGAVDLLLGTDQGNCCVAVWHGADSPGLLVEAVYVPECIAPADLHIHRFFKESPIRIVVDHTGIDVTTDFSRERIADIPENASDTIVKNYIPLFRERVPDLLRETAQSAATVLDETILSGVRNLSQTFDQEIRRLKHLKLINSNISSEEIERLEYERDEIGQHIRDARIRLDAVRLIVMNN